MGVIATVADQTAMISHLLLSHSGMVMRACGRGLGAKDRVIVACIIVALDCT